VDCAAMTIGGKEFRKGGVEVVRNKGGDDIFVAIRNDKKMTSANSVKIVLPSQTRVYAWLRASGTGSAFLSISVHRFGFKYVSFSLLV